MRRRTIALSILMLAGLAACGTSTPDGNGSKGTPVLLNEGSPRQTLALTGTVSGSGDGQTISGSYTASHPDESGTFTMNHDERP